MDFLNNNDDKGSSSEPEGYEIFDSETNSNEYYDGYDNLISISYHDFDVQGRTVYSEEYTPSGGFLYRNIYIWDGDNLVVNASYDAAGDLIAFQYNVYDGELLTETGEYDGDAILQSASLYQYTAEGEMQFSAEVDNGESGILAISGVEYAYDTLERVIRKNIFKALETNESCALPSLNANSAKPGPASVEEPLVVGASGFNAELESYKTAFEESVDPVISIDSDFSAMTPINGDILTLLSSNTRRVWDSYWAYDDISGTEGYAAITFNAETVPVIDDSDNYYYTWLEEASAEYDELFGGGLPENMNLPVQFYLDGGKGLDIDGTEVVLDSPLRMVLEYVPGLHVISSKKIWYGSHKVVQMDVSYDENGMTSNVALSGEAFILPLSFNISYLDGYSTPEILQLATGDITLQTLKYEFTGEADLDQDLVGTDFLEAVHQLWWYDENYDNSAEETVNNENALVGRFVFDYSGADSLLTLNVFDDADSELTSDEGFTGSYQLGYDPDALRSSFKSYDAAGTLIMDYSYGYDELLAQAEDAANAASEAYDTLDESDLFGDSLPEIPYYLTEGFDAESMLDFLMNEVEAFLP